MASEVWKQLCLTFQLHGGQYQWPFFSFQLCDTPVYVCIVIGICKNRRLREALVTFLADYCLLAGIMAFLDTSGFREYGYLPLILHSYLWHIAMILLGLFSGVLLIRMKEKTGFGNWAEATLVYLVFCGVAEILNLTLCKFGPINMFYISPRYVMHQIVFRDLVPVLGNNGTIVFYILMTVFGSFLVHILWITAGKWLVRKLSGTGPEPDEKL